ncbi:hypothetical protein ILUMI_02001 [Ignelater luminosus]|uniref:Lariat debranching enzyme C-terminal domain-containing protein n=1 Tax=Ignelater luminosus TaxID=2038154 RepID=A0A8K0DH88_IGNLU|nr:hypothetical protein ILUMI_02001 [Ignelater luminosus]
MKIAVEGCAHGELEIIYDTVQALEAKENVKIDLLICCGDFQASRNEADLRCMAVPPKYYNICSFYKYYTGEKEAPMLTIFVGGNHEASNYLQELPYGGWVAPNIYYLGYASVINIAGVRIGGISGIYKGQDYLKGHFETPPYDNSTKRSVYHIRNLEIFRLKQVSQPVDIFISHDWPVGIWNYGDSKQLLRCKPYFRDDMESGKLGSKPFEELLNHLQPKYWFAAHLHCKFAALVQHSEKKATKFLALDKCLPKRRFLQITDIPHDTNLKIELTYDLEWLTILNLTNDMLSVKAVHTYMPGPGWVQRWQFTPTEEEKSKTLMRFSNNLVVPRNFTKTAEAYNPQNPKSRYVKSPSPYINNQTVEFCNKLEVDDPLVLLNAFSTNIGLKEEDGLTAAESQDDLLSTEDEESEAYETFNKITPSKLSLSLPKPKYDSTQSTNFSVDSESTISVFCESTSSDTSGIVNDIHMSKDDSPMIKKFKRRNADIYCVEET